MREAIGVKTYYPNGITLLDNKFVELFEGQQGPGALPAKIESEQTSVRAVIVPHAPYDVAGQCMAWSYKALAEAYDEPPLYIIVGQAQDSSEAGLTMQTFLTPYSEVRVDQVFGRALVEKGHIELNDKVHNSESVLEIQLPFLQFIHKSKREQIKILPILLNESSEFNELAVDIKEILVEQNKQAVFIFVSNFTSYGRQFGYVPYTENISENVQELDKELLNTVKQLDKTGFEAVCKEHIVPISGYFALQLFFHLFKEGEVFLEQYYQSGSITGSYTNTVSYASLVLK